MRVIVKDKEKTLKNIRLKLVSHIKKPIRVSQYFAYEQLKALLTECSQEQWNKVNCNSKIWTIVNQLKKSMGIIRVEKAFKFL